MLTRAVVIALSLASATVAAAVPDDQISNVKLQAVVSSPCADAVAQLDLQPTGRPRCSKLEQLAVPGLGTVQLDRVAGTTLPAEGYALVLSVQPPGGIVSTVLWFTGGGCGAGTCVEYQPRSAHLVRLAPGPAFGVEVESIVVVSHTSRDLGPARSLPAHYRLACAAHARVLDCKAIVLGGRADDCRVLGWRGTRVRYSCTDEAQLVAPRSDDTAGIPQADLERIEALAQDLDRVIADHERDCPALVAQLDQLLWRDVEAIALVRSSHTPAGPLPHSLASALYEPMRRLAGAQTCLSDPAAQDALDRVFHALGDDSHVRIAPTP